MCYRLALICTVLMVSPELLHGSDESLNGVERYELKFEPGNAESKIGPSFSPHGKKVILQPIVVDDLPGHDQLTGHLRLGSPGSKHTDGHKIVVARSEPGKPYDTLIVDTDFDGDISTETPLIAKVSESRGKTWSSFSSSCIHVPHRLNDQIVYEDYPLSFWIAVQDPSVAPDIIRFSRRGFLYAPITLGGIEYFVMLADGDNDGILGEKDDWGIIPADNKRKWSKHRPIDDFVWAGGRAWKLQILGTRGRHGALVSYSPGITEQEDSQRRDRYRDDRTAVRAKQPLVFRKDVDAAIADAKRQDQRYFLDFETSWCGPCKMMDRMVYSSQAVVDAAKGIVCIKVDGDKRKDLTRRFEVGGYPTGILFTPKGEQITRFSGYQSVKRMAEYFRNTRPGQTSKRRRTKSRKESVDHRPGPPCKPLPLAAASKLPPPPIDFLVSTRKGVVLLTRDGSKRMLIPGARNSHGVEVRDNSIYAVQGSNSIVGYDFAGNERARLTIPRASGCGSITALSGGRFALAGNINDEVHFIDSEGRLLHTIRLLEPPEKHLQNLDGIQIGNQMVLSEDGRKRLQVFDLDTYEVSIYKDLSSWRGWLGAITSTPETFYVCQGERILKFSGDDEAVVVANLPENNITGIVVCDGWAYVSVNFAGKVFRVDLATGAHVEFASGLDDPSDIESISIE